MADRYLRPEVITRPGGWLVVNGTMPQKLLKSAHFIELGNYHYWPVLVPRGIRLYTYEQIPSFLKDNPYITDGYRAYLPSKLCLKSLFILSNETVNIWSHLLGFFLFFSLGIYDMIIVLPEANASKDDYVIYSICLFCFQVCLLCSVGYHLFCCHRSEKANRRWMALDYAGIAIGILGCYVPAVFYAFYCNEALVPRIFMMYFMGALAFFLYITKIPERYFPGQVNYLGSSHQCWHILVVLMFYWWHQTGVYITQYRHNQPCSELINT
ncbi:progestin and adipoQ receptor family member 3a isoform X3 [Rhinoraja longicauda]